MNTDGHRSNHRIAFANSVGVDLLTLVPAMPGWAKLTFPAKSDVLPGSNAN